MNSSEKIFKAFRAAGVDCDRDDMGCATLVHTRFMRDGIYAIVSFICKDDGGTFSFAFFSFDGRRRAKCKDLSEGLKVCNELNQGAHLFYTFFIDEENTLQAQYVFPPGVDEGSFALQLFSLFITKYKEEIVDKISKCI